MVKLTYAVTMACAATASALPVLIPDSAANAQPGTVASPSLLGSDASNTNGAAAGPPPPTMGAAAALVTPPPGPATTIQQLGASYHPLVAVPDPDADGSRGQPGGLSLLAPATPGAPANGTSGGGPSGPPPPNTKEIVKNVVNQVSSLAASLASFMATDNPTALLNFASGLINLVTSFMLDDGQPTAEQKWQQDVSQKLSQIQADLGQIEISVDKTLQVVNEIQIALDDTQLQDTLRAMVAPTSIIDAAFEAYTQYAKLVVNNDPSVPHDSSPNDPSVALYKLLTDGNSPNGPNNVYIAMKQVQQYILGTQGADVGVLSYLPRLVSDQYKKCSMDTSKLTDLSSQLTDSFGPFYDTLGHIAKDCVNSTFMLQGDGSLTGMSVQAIAQKILVTQFKGIAVLVAAYVADPLNQYRVTDYIMPNMQRIGQNLAALWPAITQDIDAYALGMVYNYGQKLSVNRANQYWLGETFAVCADSCPPFNPYYDWTQHGLPSDIPMGMLTTACTANTPGFPAGTVYPCLTAGPAILDSGYTDTSATVFRFGKGGGPNGGIECYYNHKGSVNLLPPHQALPPVPDFIKTIEQQYPLPTPPATQ